MDSERIVEIQKETAYSDSISVHNALIKVWNETAGPGEFKCEDCTINSLRLAMQKGILNTDVVCDGCIFNPGLSNQFVAKEVP